MIPCNFMCNIEDFKFLADMIQHVPLPLRARYVFCCAPINKKMPFVCTMFLKRCFLPSSSTSSRAAMVQSVFYSLLLKEDTGVP
ncbi:unnamed protein product [Timema podura]|uniref:Suv3 C-terminal domain-containing protein n=1 Tax=Timema podura TaxID=61482 RepID=A0ABN7P0K2_TIMPD|nr:unnamed protein product [Timema podura]